MSYNIRHGAVSSLAVVAAAIAAEDPDLVGLQDVDDLTNRSGRVHQTEELAALTKLPYRYFCPNFRYDGGFYGVAVLSRFALSSPRVVRLDQHTRPGGGVEPRIALAVDVDAPGKPLTFVTLHASLIPGERPGNAQALLTALGAQRRPSVVVGDFNEAPGGALGDALLAAGFVDAFLQNTGNPLAGPTAPASLPVRRIDFVYKDAEFGPTQQARVPATLASDHRPVVVTFDTAL